MQHLNLKSLQMQDYKQEVIVSTFSERGATTKFYHFHPCSLISFKRSLFLLLSDDTGLTAGGVRIYFTKDPIGELKSAEATGGDIRSLASETASVGVIEGLQSIRPFTSTVDAQATSSVSAEVYSLYNVAASIAELE